MTALAAKNLVIAIFVSAFEDLLRAGKIHDSAVHFFESGAYIFYAQFLDIDPSLLWEIYQGRLDYRQLELFA